MNRSNNNTMCSIRWSALAVLTLLIASPQTLTAVEKMVVECEAEIELAEGGETYAANVDLGRLPVSESVTVKVTLKNPFDEAVKFSGVSNKCACKQFKSYNSLIPANGETVAEYTINTPARNRSVDVDTSIALVEKGESVVKIDMHYKLDGLLAFSELLGVVRFSSDAKTMTKTIPFVYSSPIQFENINAELTGKLKKASIEISKTESGGLLTVTIPDETVAKGNVRGEVHLTYEGTDDLDCYYLSVKDARVNEISPNVVQFRQQDGGGWAAKAIVRIAGLVNAESAKTSEPEGAIRPSKLIRCYWQDEEIELSVKSLKNNTFRVMLVPNESQAKKLHAIVGDTESKKSLVWEINNGNKTTKMVTDFRFLPE